MRATTLDKTAFRDERIDQLNSWQETLYHRILIYVGDNDEMPADPMFIRNTLFPLKKTLRATQVDSALKALHSANLIGLGSKEPSSGTYLWIVRPEKPYSPSEVPEEGGEPFRSRGSRLFNNFNKHGNGDEDGVTNEGVTDKPNLGIADEFGITDEEVERHRKTMDEIESVAKDFGLSTSLGSLRFAMQLVTDYGLETVKEAIEQCIDVPKWNYVAGILRVSKSEGKKPGETKKAEKKASKWYSSETAAEAEKRAAEKWGESFSGFDEFDT